MEIAVRFKKTQQDKLIIARVVLITQTLIWMHCPEETNCVKLGVGARTLFCSRKHKFGLNFEEICNDSSNF